MKRQDRKRCDARSAGAAPLRTLDAAARPCRALRAIRSAVDRGAPMTRLLRPARFLGLSLGLSLRLTSPAAAAEAEAVLLLDPAAVSVELRGAGGLSLPGCRAVDWQRFDATAGRFLSIPQPGCGAPTPTTRVPADGMRIAAPVRLAPGDTVRAVVVLGEGCAPELPLPLAGCRALRALESKPLTVPQPAE
jgi:hypothetical protein